MKPVRKAPKEPLCLHSMTGGATLEAPVNDSWVLPHMHGDEDRNCWCEPTIFKARKDGWAPLDGTEDQFDILMVVHNDR